MAIDYGKAYIEAKSQGYSDDEIAKHLVGDSGKYQEAIANGYSPSDIIQHFTGIGSQMRPAGDYADLSSEVPTPIPGTSLAEHSQDQALELPPEMRALNALNTAGAGFGVGQLAGLAATKAGPLISKAKAVLTAPKTAQTLAPTEDALSLGLRAQGSQTAQLGELKAANDALYAKIPQDFRAATPAVNEAADNVIAKQASLPKSFQSSKIAKMAQDLQELGKSGGTPFSTVNDIRSQLSDLAYNGAGPDKLYATQLLKALNKDIEAVGSSPASLSNIPSQQASQFAQDLRELWTDLTKRGQQPGMEDMINQAGYVNPNAVQGAAPLTNSDIPQNLQAANNLFKQRMDLQNHPVTQSLLKARPEEMWKVAFSRGNVSDVNVAKQGLGPIGFNAIRQQFYDSLLNTRDLGTKLAKYSPEFLNSALGPEMTQGLQRLAQFKQVLSRAAVLGGALTAGTVLGGGYQMGRRLLQQ